MGEVTMSANNQSAQGGDNHINLYEPHVWKHHTKVAGLEWKNPVGTASGTFQYAAVRRFYDVSQLGAVCTKGASPVPWEGNPSPRTAESPAANINAVGLQNPGIDHYLAEDLPKLKAAGAFVISNVAGHCDDDYAAVVEKLADSDADMLEINVSCPNVSAGGMSVGTDPVALANLMDRLRPMTDKPMIVKLTPNVTDITVPARAAVEHGADALSMINTLKGMRINIRTGKPIIANVTGGVSGPAVLPVGLAGCAPHCRRFRSSASAASTAARRRSNTCTPARTPSKWVRPRSSTRWPRCASPANSTTCWTAVPNSLLNWPQDRLGGKEHHGRNTRTSLH